MQISRGRLEIEAWYLLPTNRKRPMVDRMMMLSMTSRDLKGLGRDTYIFNARYFENGSRSRLSYNGAPIGNGMCGTE